MTWPMHDAGSTTPDPGPEEARRREPWYEEPWHEEAWHEEPWPEEPEPGDDGPPRRGRNSRERPVTRGRPRLIRCRRWKARCRAAARARPRPPSRWR